MSTMASAKSVKTKPVSGSLMTPTTWARAMLIEMPNPAIAIAMTSSDVVTS